ncbi:MAG: extracellular solute-binding protein [Spirochaetaceae bacterium]|jgi:spermidine/putrescine transport system substrate-binding protein|nr:extracellular solute-binding protein [Spirochaetaceae bacterium]
MKKIPVLAAAAILGAVNLGGCSGDKLYIYNWTYYTPVSVIEKFEKEYGVKVVYDEFASNEEMYTKLQAGGSGYDIIFPSGDYVSIMISQGMLERIDKSKLSNLGNVDPLVLQKATYDPAMEYSVPYYWGAAGIVVNTEKIPNFEKSWSIFARTDLRGRMTMLDDMREVLGDALVSLGYSVNTKDPEELQQARDLVNNFWRPNLVKFDSEAFGKGYANGDFWAVQGYPEVVYEEIAGDEDLLKNTVFFIPPSGGPAYVDSLCILKGAKNIDLAHKFIDFIHRPAIYAEFTDAFGFPATANSAAGAFKKEAALYSAEDIANTELKDDLGDALEMYTAAWETIKMGY